eukprot:scaffold25103_cov113-Cylindrotheca_fusiformis.AAC.3
MHSQPSLQINQERCKAMKRRKCKSVSFHPRVKVHFDLVPLNKDDCNRMHYTREEMRSFSQEIRQLQTLTKGNETLASPQIDMNTTGIESFVNPSLMERKRRNKLLAVLTVILEQNRQYWELGLYTPIDFDSMSNVYHNATEKSQVEAHRRALQTNTPTLMTA